MSIKNLTIIIIIIHCLSIIMVQKVFGENTIKEDGSDQSAIPVAIIPLSYGGPHHSVELYGDLVFLAANDLTNSVNSLQEVSSLNYQEVEASVNKAGLYHKYRNLLDGYKKTFTFNPTLLNEIAKALSIKFLILISSGVDTQSHFINETKHDKLLSFFKDNDVKDPLNKITLLYTLVDAQTGSILWKKNLSKNLSMDQYSIASQHITTSQNIANTMQTFSQKASTEVSGGIYEFLKNHSHRAVNATLTESPINTEQKEITMSSTQPQPKKPATSDLSSILNKPSHVPDNKEHVKENPTPQQDKDKLDTSSNNLKNTQEQQPKTEQKETTMSSTQPQPKKPATNDLSSILNKPSHVPDNKEHVKENPTPQQDKDKLDKPSDITKPLQEHQPKQEKTQIQDIDKPYDSPDEHNKSTKLLDSMGMLMEDFNEPNAFQFIYINKHEKQKPSNKHK